MVYNQVNTIDFTLDSLPNMPMPAKVLMANPAYFDVAYVINPHMEGHIGSIDTDKALLQWKELKATYDALGIESSEVAGVPGYPDMVFCANQTLPFLNLETSSCGVILSNMHAPQRKGEVEFVASFFEGNGYKLQHLNVDFNSDFEGMGDAVWHTDHHLLWGGHGYRTQQRVYEEIAQLLNVKVLTLELSDPDFYHLDTCFCVLDSQTVLIYRGAFSDDGVAMIRHFFRNVIESPEHEARNLFSCNAHCPDKKHVIIQEGCTETKEKLIKAGFKPVEVDTSEFLKSGGSVFCMKQMFW